jgi:hypothetical protein
MIFDMISVRWIYLARTRCDTRIEMPNGGDLRRGCHTGTRDRRANGIVNSFTVPYTVDGIFYMMFF